MRAKSAIRLAVAEIAAVAINIVGLGLWFYEDYSADSTMLIYTLGAFSAIVFAIVTVLFVSPRVDPNGPPNQKRKLKVITDFMVIAFFIFGVPAVFISVFLFLLRRDETDLDAQTIWVAFAIVLAFQFAEFIADVLSLRPMPLNKAENYMYSKGLGQSAVLFVSVFAGVFIAFFLGNSWFAVPLFLLKLIIDIAQPIQFFLGGTGLPPSNAPQFHSRLLIGKSTLGRRGRNGR